MTERDQDDPDGLAYLGIGHGDDILVVDDVPTNLVAIEAALAPLGRNVITARDGMDALVKLLDQDFALILLDVAMPGMDGIETARLVRSRERTRGTPIIFVTGRTWEDTAIEEAYEAGGFDFVIKPVRAEVLRAKARVFLQLQERTRALQYNARRLQESLDRLHEHELVEQRKRFESALLETRMQQIAEHERKREELVAILGHELRNPLQTLQLTFDVLREHPNADKTERIYSLLDRRFAHVNRLVEDLLDVARSSSGQLELRLEPVDVGVLAQQALDDSHSTIEKRHHRVSLEIASSIPPIVQGDPVRLVQVFTNVIDNAARYTPDGGSIDVRVTVDAGDVVARISDTGRGIPDELLGRIFDMFVRERAASDGSGGLGLGLGLVKRLVELHDGTVRATSAGVGQGSMFEIRLPLAPQELAIPMNPVVELEGEPPVTIDELE